MCEVPLCRRAGMTALYYIVMFWMGQFVFVTLFLGVILKPQKSMSLKYEPASEPLHTLNPQL